MKRLFNYLNKSLGKKFKVAFEGIYNTFKEELSFRYHTYLLLLVIFMGVFLNISLYEWLAVVIVASVVLASEMMNTAIESLVDMYTLEFNLKAKKIKDIGAGAVLITALSASIVGMIIFIPKIIDYLGGLS